MDERKLRLIVDEMLAFADNHDDKEAVKLSVFFKRKGYCSSDVWAWQQKWPWFKKAYKFIKEAIGDRREIGALYRELSEGIVLRTMPMYDDEWLRESDRVAKLRNEQQKAEAAQTVKVLVEEIKSFGEDKK
jgi:hypothetical protein